MSSTYRSLLRSFGGGEITPELFGRFDLAKNQTGLALCRNFTVLPHGPVTNRAGTAYVNTVKDSTKKTRLIPFTFSSTQTMVIEVGAGAFRFHTQGATLLNAGVPYEVANPYFEADLFDLHYVQSADVMTLTHPKYAVRELRRLGATNWALTLPTFQSPTNAPTTVTTAATGTGTINYEYVATAVNKDNLEETSASPASAAVTNNLSVAGNFNTITWVAPASGTVIRYNVYKRDNGLFGFIGQTDGLTFKDANITADISRTPPISDITLNTVDGDYPGAVSYYEQRRVFAGTLNKPQNLWMTRSATESNLGYSIPVRADDRIAFRIAAREASSILHVVPLNNLLLLTASAEWRISSADGGALTPASISVKPQSYNGASNVQPVVVNNAVLYAAVRGGRMRELAFQVSNVSSGYVGQDISVMAPHLFDYFSIADVALAKAPHPIVWCVSSNGKLLGCTYMPEQQVTAWHQHDTDGAFESVAVVAEGNEDRLYVVVRRTIGGVVKRFVERLASRNFAAPADAFFVDAGATYAGAAATVISGLAWLEGKTVNILADGAVVPPQVVTSGAITLPIAAVKVQVGLPITADIQTLPLAVESAQAFGQGRTKNVNRVFLRVVNSGGIKAGPSLDRLVEFKQRSTERYGMPPNLVTGEIEIVLNAGNTDGGQVYLRQTDPLPVTLVSMTLEASVNG